MRELQPSHRPLELVFLQGFFIAHKAGFRFVKIARGVFL